MLDVFFTVDVEVWCGGWNDLDRQFPEAFQRYVYGCTPTGEYGLRHQCRVLADHGLRAVFFVEPMFSGRFGIAPLAEIVGVLTDHRQDVQLHMHTEWMDEWPEPLLAGVRGKRQFMRDWSAAEQNCLVGEGLRRLELAGGGRAIAFRAGSFGLSAATLDALTANGVRYDSSYNAAVFGPDSGVSPGRMLVDVCHQRGVLEVPMTVYWPGIGALRHVQIGACSSREIETLLWQALEEERGSFVLLSHNFELLSQDKTRVDPVVARRFQRLAAFLDRHRDCFAVRGFAEGGPPRRGTASQPLRGRAVHAAWRVAEQLYRRRFG